MYSDDEQKILQEIAGGALSLMIAEHKEDSIENLLKYRAQVKNG